MNYPNFCSGFISAMENGTTIHARNMDYPLQFEHKGKLIGWPELTIQVLFIRNKKPLYISVNWPNQLGIHTAMRFDGWSFEQNTRRTGFDVEDNMEAGRRGGLLYGVLARQVMESVPDYATAVDTLHNANFMSSSYFILAGTGPYEAAVLSI